MKANLNGRLHFPAPVARLSPRSAANGSRPEGKTEITVRGRPESDEERFPVQKFLNGRPVPNRKTRHSATRPG